MKKILALVIAFCIATSSIPGILLADTVDVQTQINAIQAERQKLLEQQQKLLTALTELGKDKQSLSTNIKTLDATRAKLLNDLKITQNNIANSDLSIQKLSANINRNEHEIVVHNKAIETAIKSLSYYDSHTIVYDLLAYKNISEVWGDVSNLSTLQEKLREEIAMLRGVQTELTKNKAEQEAAKQSLKSLANQLAGQKQVVEQTKTAKNKLLAETKSQESAYQKMLVDNMAREKEFEAQLFQFESALKAANTGSAPSAANNILLWPLGKIKVTQQFGKTSSSGRLYASGTHNGIDFGIPVGTAILNVRNGIVKGQGNTDSQNGCYSYGRWMLIEHDNGLSTIYGHLSASTVGTGQAVTAGQIIGYTGGQPGAFGSGYSTGPHLHFGLLVTAGVRIQPYSSSINCKGVSIPIANPVDYLDPLSYLPKL